MSYAIFYDPCSRCEHKDTKKMCNMCLLTYFKNMHPSVKSLTTESPKELNPNLYKSMNWEKMNDYVDEIFDNIRIKLEDQSNEQRACQVEQSSREDN